MRYDEAAKQSLLRMSLRTSDSKLEVYDSHSGGFFSVDSLSTGAWEVSRKPRGSKSKDDWGPLILGSIAEGIGRWKADQEGRSLVIEKPWEKACEASPVGRAIRTKQDRLLMVRDLERRTWVEVLNGQVLTPKSGPFREYDGWLPMPADHYYATIDLTQEYNHRLPDGGRFGFPALNGEKAPEPKPRKPVPSPNASYIKVEGSAITAAASMAQSLAAAIAVTSGSDRAELVKELTRLSGHLSWHLREDRGKYRVQA